MTLALVAHIPTPSDARLLHLWVGIADSDTAPNLSWKLNGAVSTPRALRPLARVLSGALATGNERVFAGFYEFSGLAANTEYEIELTAGSDRIIRAVRTLPESVPPGPQDRLNVLLLSCFHRLEDKTGVAGKILSQSRVKPHITLFMGDQVYLDLPTLRNFRNDRAWLGGKFQGDYLDNWFGNRTALPAPRAIPAGFPQLLALAPAAFVPDDHEYWNNYPFLSALVENSWTGQGRKRWAEAAERTYEGFQQSRAAQFGAARNIVIEPLSILVLDTRSQRDKSSRKRQGDLLGHQGRLALTNWAKNLAQSAASASPRYGVLVTGQSLFRSASGTLRGNIADFEFPDYEEDYRFMVAELERVTQSGLPVLCVTGDVHWGRMLRADEGSGRSGSVFEVISSPTSLVSTVFMDQASQVWSTIRGWFGSRNPWPRHDDPEEPPPRFGTAMQYSTQVMLRADGKRAAMRGNHAIMLRFVRAGSGLKVETYCCPLHGDDAVNAAEEWSASFELRATR